MQPHQQRVVDELADLDDKLGKLNAFFTTTFFSTLPAPEQYRLNRQSKIMTLYSDVLHERIDAFTDV